MIRLIRAELLKLRTTQVWFWLLLAALAVSALFVIGPFATGDVRSSRDVANVFSGAGTGYIVVFVLGVLGVTTEFRYQTITPTVLVTPSRWTLIAAKLVTYAVVGVLYALACVILQLLIAVPWLAAQGTDVAWGSHGIPRAIGGAFIVLALFGIVGLGIGALLRNQIVAVAIGVIFLAVIQGIFIAIPKVKYVFPYLPGGGVDAILAVNGDRTINGVTLFPPVGGVIVLLCWAFIPALVGASFTMTRDIT